jgi:hypothetical protein
MLDIDRSGDFFVDEQMLEFPAFFNRLPENSFRKAAGRR